MTTEDRVKRINARINILKNRKMDNTNIITKLQRQLRKLET